MPAEPPVLKRLQRALRRHAIAVQRTDAGSEVVHRSADEVRVAATDYAKWVESEGGWEDPFKGSQGHSAVRVERPETPPEATQGVAVDARYVFEVVDKGALANAVGRSPEEQLPSLVMALYAQQGFDVDAYENIGLKGVSGGWTCELTRLPRRA